MGDAVGEDEGASDVQHASAHSSATLATPHLSIWCRKLQLAASRTSGMFDRAHTKLDVGVVVGDAVGVDDGASDVQHVSAHNSATLGTMHWFVWCNSTYISGSDTSGNRGTFDRAHTGLDVGEIVGGSEGDNVGKNEGEVVGEAVGAIEGDTVGPILGDKCW